MSTIDAAAGTSRTLEGIAWMVLTGLMFACVTGIVRYLGSDMPAIEAAFIRYAIGLALISPIVIKAMRRRPSTHLLKLYTARGLVHGIAVMLWFYAMARIPIAEVTALGYTAPIFVTIGAWLFLDETLHVRRIAGVIAGLIGVFIIVRPGFESINSGQLAQIATAPLFAASFLLAKKLTETEDSATIVGMLSVFCTLVLLPGAIMQWRTPTVEEVMWLGLTAVFATAGHYTLTRAFAAAPITVTQPVSFLQLVWASLIGIALFNEMLDPFVILGGGVIVAAATYISHRETRAAREASTPPAPATKI
ncbi:MAG: DMT family transporter [Hyphomicrobiales bacterium]